MTFHFKVDKLTSMQQPPSGLAAKEYLIFIILKGWHYSRKDIKKAVMPFPAIPLSKNLFN